MSDGPGPAEIREKFALAALEKHANGKAVQTALIAAGYNHKPYALIPIPKDVLGTQALTDFCESLLKTNSDIKEIRLLDPVVGPTYKNGNAAYKHPARLSLWTRKPTIFERVFSPDKSDR